MFRPRLFLALAAMLFAHALAYAQNLPSPNIAAPAWLLLDYRTGDVLVSEQADERREPASLTKLMTAYLVFSALKGGQLSGDQMINPSERAWRTSGSRMFIEPNKPVGVDDLIKGMIVQSGNDACVALAEAIAGSEDTFAQMMNREAQRLGMKNSHFVNSTGLSDPGHYSTARDLSILARALVRDFPEYYRLYSTRSFTYNGIPQSNRNRLLAIDPSVDGMKTGFTEVAGYCLISSAQRGERRLISVVLGTDSDAARTEQSLKLLNYGFQFYDTVKLYGAAQPLREFEVFKGEQKTVKAGFADDFVMSLPKGQAERLKATLSSRQPLVAPIAKGDEIGRLKLELDGKALGDYPVIALDAVPVAGFFGRTWDAIRLWLN